MKQTEFKPTYTGYMRWRRERGIKENSQRVFNEYAEDRKLQFDFQQILKKTGFKLKK